MKKLLDAIFGRIFALWALVTFMLTFFIIFIPAMLTHLLPDPRSSDWFIRIARFWMNLWLPIAGCPIRITGREHFEKGKAYIICCNHNSLMDVPLSSPYIPGPNKTIAKKSFTRIPLFGLFYAKGSVLVDRRSDQSRKESYLKMKAVLAAGMHMCIYPEGTRNKSEKLLGPFHGGAFRLAADTRNSIIPAVILNTKKVLPIHRAFYFMPHRLELHFLPPIPVSPGDTADQLKERTYNIMLEELSKY